MKRGIKGERSRVELPVCLVWHQERVAKEVPGSLRLLGEGNNVGR